MDDQAYNTAGDMAASSNKPAAQILKKEGIDLGTAEEIAFSARENLKTRTGEAVSAQANCLASLARSLLGE
jgi:hypothetical protein